MYEIIRANVERNRLPNVHGLHAAVGAASGRAEFFRDLDDSSMSSLLTLYGPRHRLEASMVDVVTCDDFVRDHAIGGELVVKVDVENAEWSLIEGAETALCSFPYLVMEVLGPARQRGLVDHLIRMGFQAYYINGLRLEHMKTDDGRYTQGEWNWLFCRDKPEALAEKMRPSPLLVA